MSTIIGAQSAFAAWQQAMAEATGGKVFTTHGCDWAWLPARRRLVLLFPAKPLSAGLRPGLAEGNRLGATEVSVWLNAAVPDAALREFGFRDAAPVLWHAGELSGSPRHWEGRIGLDTDVPEAKGPDADELQVAVQWKSPGRTRTPVVGDDGVATVRVGAGHPSKRRVEHATARTADGTLVGRGFAQYTDVGTLALHGLAVAPAHRGQGVGRGIVKTLAEAASSPARAGTAGAGRGTTDVGAPSGGGDSGNDGGAATLPGGGADVVAGCRPGSSGFFTACGLQLIGRGRHLVLRGS